MVNEMMDDKELAKAYKDNAIHGTGKYNCPQFSNLSRLFYKAWRKAWQDEEQQDRMLARYKRCITIEQWESVNFWYG